MCQSFVKFSSLSMLSVCISAILSPVYAAEPTAYLGELSATVKRDKTQLKDSAQKILVIGRDEIARQLLTSDDTSYALAKLIPGYAPNTDKMGSVGESFRGREVLFMIDGVPQSNPLRDGNRESRTIDLSMVDKIEVVYGASSEQGLGATGGIVNFVTKSVRNDGVKQSIVLGANIHDTLKSDSLGANAAYQASFGNDKMDGLVGIKYNQNGLYYQADGRAMGVYGNQGDVMNADSLDVFVKGGYNLDDDKKLTASVNYYHLEGSQEYINVPGDRKVGLTDTSRKYALTDGEQGKNPYNHVITANVVYNDNDFFGVNANTQVFYQDFTARYGANKAANYQDPKYLPVGKLLDQSQNESTKFGLKLTANKDGLLNNKLSVTAGLDAMQDKTEQKLIRYGRAWTPLMTYQNIAPFVQGKLNLLEDRLSLSAGVRYESGKLDVSDFKTLAAYTRNSKDKAVPKYSQIDVAGGQVNFEKTLTNLGLVYDLTPKWQLYTSYSQGFGLPDVGGTLRAVSTPHQSVNQINLEPIITKNTEAGVRFDGDIFAIDASIYQSKSDMGSTLVYNDNFDTYSIARQKTDIKGFEIIGTANFNNHNITTSYAHTAGKYDKEGDGIMARMPARNISPDKLSLGYNYKLTNQKHVGLHATHYFSRKYPELIAGKNTFNTDFDGYTLVDFTYSQPLGRGVLGFGVNNLLNEKYLNFLTDSVLPNSDRFSGGRGRNYTLSYRVEF